MRRVRRNHTAAFQGGGGLGGVEGRRDVGETGREAHVDAARSRSGSLYNGRRPHTAVGDRTPDEAYFTQRTL